MAGRAGGRLKGEGASWTKKQPPRRAAAKRESTILPFPAKGEAVWTAEYEAWGRIRQETVSDGLKANIPFRFQGQYYDEESGLHYNRFRYYDPEIGRFVSQDPIGLKGGENLYAYVNNPNQWVDILGLSKRKGAAVKDCSSECQLRDPCGSGSGQKPWSMRYEENSGKHKKMDIG